MMSFKLHVLLLLLCKSGQNKRLLADVGLLCHVGLKITNALLLSTISFLHISPLLMSHLFVIYNVNKTFTILNGLVSSVS